MRNLRQSLLGATAAAVMLAPLAAQGADTTTTEPKKPVPEQTQTQTPNKAPVQEDEAGSASMQRDSQAAGTDRPLDSTEGEEGAASSTASSDAVIPQEDASFVRAKALIGSSVLGPDGEEVGSVQDVIFSDEGELVGIVVSSGGWLGIGSKVVGISYTETEIMSDESGQRQVVRANLTKEQIESAPSFKTKEDIAAEQQRQTAPTSPMGGAAGGAGSMTN